MRTNKEIEKMPAALTPEQKAERVTARKAKEAEAINNGSVTARAPVAGTGEQPVRRKRATFNGTQGKMTVDFSRLDELGFHGHIFNDTPGRIQQALDVGYEFVEANEVGSVATNVISKNTDIGDKVRFLAGSTDKGEPMYAYLMKIRKEFYEEDQAEAQAKIDVVDNAIRGGKLTGEGHTSEGFYNAGIKFSQG